MTTARANSHRISTPKVKVAAIVTAMIAASSNRIKGNRSNLYRTIPPPYYN